MDFSIVSSFSKLPKKVIFLITIISSILLFSPQSFLETIAIYKFKEQYTIWIGIVFLFSIGLSFIHFIEYIQEFLTLRKQKKGNLELIKIYEKKYKNILESLDNDELVNIREFYDQQKNTIEMIYDDSAVAGLVKKGIISFVAKQGWSDIYTSGTVCKFEITSEAKKYFDIYDFDKLSSIPRPIWLKGIETSSKMKQNIENMQNTLMNNF